MNLLEDLSAIEDVKDIVKRFPFNKKMEHNVNLTGHNGIKDVMLTMYALQAIHDIKNWCVVNTAFFYSYCKSLNLPVKYKVGVVITKGWTCVHCWVEYNGLLLDPSLEYGGIEDDSLYFDMNNFPYKNKPMEKIYKMDCKKHLIGLKRLIKYATDLEDYKLWVINKKYIVSLSEEDIQVYLECNKRVKARNSK